MKVSNFNTHQIGIVRQIEYVTNERRRNFGPGQLDCVSGFKLLVQVDDHLHSWWYDDVTVLDGV